LDGDEDDLELLRRLLRKYAARGSGSEAFRALIRRGVRFAMEQAWSYYQDSVTAQRAPDVAYWRAVFFFWNLLNWYNTPCRVLVEVTTYVAEAVAKYRWPARWPFLAMAAAAAEKKGCKIPDAAAEALGPDEYSRLEAFLKQGEGSVEAAGRKFAIVKKRRYVTIVEYKHGDRNSKNQKEIS
jgi:hypothetical protein